MVSHSLIGRVLLGSYFIFSGWKMLRGSFKDPKYKEEFTSKFAGLLNFSELFGATDSLKLNIVAFFETFFAGEQVVGGFSILFDNLTLGVLYLGVYLLIATPILFDFYHYKVGEPEFLLLLQGFLQNMAFFGVLLIFVEMNTTIGRKMTKWTLDPTQLQKNILPEKSRTQHHQPQNNIPTKSMTQHRRDYLSPQSFLLPMLHTYQLIMPSQDINLSVDLLSQQIHESSFLTTQLNDPHKQE